MANYNWPVNPTSVNPGPVQFERDGLPTEVSEDTITPANSVPLPVKPLNAAGTPVDFATETTQQLVRTNLDELNARLAGALVPEQFDYQELTSVTVGNGIGEIQTVTYKLGGSGGTTVAVLTLAYDANDRLSSVTRS